MTSIVLGSLVGSSTIVVPAKRLPLRSQTTWSSVTIRLIERTPPRVPADRQRSTRLLSRFPGAASARLGRIVVERPGDANGGGKNAQNKPAGWPPSS